MFSLFFLILFVISSPSSVVILFSVTWFPLFFQLFPLLMDCLKFCFSYSHLLHVVDDLLSMLCRAIVWDDIVLGSNKKGGKLSGGNYVTAIYLESIVKGQFSGWQFFVANYQWSIILWDNSLAANFLGGTYLWGNILGGNYPGGSCLVPGRI